VKTRQSQAVAGHPINLGSPIVVGPVAAQISLAQVIRKDEHDVGAIRGGGIKKKQVQDLQEH
jgi:hypothetical protein